MDFIKYETFQADKHFFVQNNTHQFMPTTLRERLDIAKELVGMFQAERITFYLISLVSVIALLTVAIYCFISKNLTSDVFVALFAPAGGITIACGKLLKMFNDCLKFLQDYNN